MGYGEAIKELFRPALPVRQDILERERKFNEDNPSRETWVLNHVYLCEGDLKDLEKHPDYRSFHADHIFAHYAALGKYSGKKCKKVKVAVSGSDVGELEKRLKLELYSRGCNAGVFYRSYKKNNSWVGEAVPATLS